MSLFILFQVVVNAAIIGIFNDLRAADPRILDIYRNAAIGFGSLAAINFSWARAIDDDTKNKKLVIKSGEMFLKSAIFAVIALSFRAYALQNMSKLPITHWGWQNITGFISFMISMIIILFCLINAVSGIIDVVLVLQNREKGRRKG